MSDMGDTGGNATTATASSTVIPVHYDYDDDDDDDDDDQNNDLPHWTLIEVNGELLPPTKLETTASMSGCCELGSLWFDTDNVRFLY
jgi:hypothetical protein